MIHVIPIKAQHVSLDSLYWQAYYEIADMLDGKKTISIKRAVFLSEWAYLDGKLDYQKDFCDEISRIAHYINNVILLNKFDKYKTAKQFSLCNYFFRPCNGNGKVPYEYDLGEEYPRGDWHHQLVSKTLRTHKGQCHTLPMTFKLIAEELKADAFIAIAPGHSYIMYKDDDDHYPEEWVNVETTTHEYLPTFAIKEHYLIKDSAVLVGTYMKPLTDLETVACQLAHLSMSYLEKYPNHYDAFTYICAIKTLQYYAKNTNAIIIASNSLDAFLLNHLQKNGGFQDKYTDEIDRLQLIYKQMLDNTYMTVVTDDLDDKWSNEWKNAKEPIKITREMYNQMMNKQ